MFGIKPDGLATETHVESTFLTKITFLNGLGRLLGDLVIGSFILTVIMIYGFCALTNNQYKKCNKYNKHYYR